MKLVTFDAGSPKSPLLRLGALTPKGIIDLNAADPAIPPSMLAFLEAGDRALAAARRALAAGAKAIPLRQARLKAPLPNPGALRDFFAFEEHARRGAERRGEKLRDEWYEIPAYYKGNHRSVIGPGEVIPWPSYTRRLDFETEIACVVGKYGKNLTPEQAKRHIAGYMIFNDVSARDIQKKEMLTRMGPAKSKDFCNVFGPYLLTADEMPPWQSVRLRVSVNGKRWSSGRYSDCYWSFPQMISHVSQEEGVYPGDVFGSGTYYSGCGLDMDRWIKPGDRLELTVTGLGTLENRIGRPTSSRPLYYDIKTKKRVSAWK